MKRTAAWLVLIALVYVLIEGISLVGWRVFGKGNELSRPIRLTDTQKTTLRMFAFGDLACFRSAAYARFESSHPDADELLEPIKIVEDGATCIPMGKITDELRTQLAGAIERLNRNTGGVVFSASFGWDLKPDHAQDRPYPARFNSDGIRSRVEYDIPQSSSKTRIAALGDSFTHGNDVADTDAWPYQLESLTPNVEVLNFGAGFYGLGQSYLKYRDKVRRYKPHVVLIGFLDRNLERDVNRFRYFYAPHDHFIPTAPRFKVNGRDLELIPNPIQHRKDYLELLGEDRDLLEEIGQTDYFFPRFYFADRSDYSPTIRLVKSVYRTLRRKARETPIYERGLYNPESEAYRVVTAIFDAFYTEVIADQAIPVIIVFPSRENLNLYREKQIRAYQPLLDHFDARKMRYIDTLDGLNSLGGDRSADDFYRGHFTPYGNEIVARTIKTVLIRDGLIGPSKSW